MRTDPHLDLVRSVRRNLLAGTAGILFVFGGAGGWAATTELSSAVVSSGTLVVEGNAKKVQHPEGGIITELLVHEGQQVTAGETIIRMDDTAARAGLAAVEKNIIQLLARQARLEAERDGLTTVEVPEELNNRLRTGDATSLMASERRLFMDRRSSRDGQKAQLAEQVDQLREQITGLEVQRQANDDEMALIAKELEGKRRLYELGVITLNQVNTLDRNATRLRGEGGQLVASIATSRGKIAELELQVLQVDQELRTEVAAELRDVANQLATLAEDEVTARDRLKHSVVKAPISGVVHMLSVHTVGGVVTTAETLMEIVPQSSALTVEAHVSPQDIDQIAIGQATRLRFTAFNRNTTPEASGLVIRVSADLETDQQTGINFYRVAISIADREVQQLPTGLALLPGMPVETFIVIGDRSVASYFMKPMRDHANRVFRED
ncbi:hemolysin secretion protein D (plasmid) [Rhizobium sp. ACO-34A]|nr:hemolysin secretion protein D [Rhizobium sp. ACO-34A]